MVELKVNDKVILYTTRYGFPMSLRVYTVEKVNKATYKLKNGHLIYKENMRRRGEPSYGGLSFSYYPYSKEKFREMRDLFHLREYENVIESSPKVKDYIQRFGLDTFIEYLTIQFEEQKTV